MFIGLGLALSRQSGRGSPPAFVNTVAPVVSGTTEEGETLSVTNGSWTPSPAGYTYQWKRDGSNIGSATSATYLLVLADVDSLISCVVTANDGGSGTTPATSNSVGPIDPAPSASYLLLMSGGGDRLKLMSGDNFLLLGAGGVPAGAVLDTNGDPILDLDGQYILEV